MRVKKICLFINSKNHKGLALKLKITKIVKKFNLEKKVLIALYRFFNLINTKLFILFIKNRSGN